MSVPRVPRASAHYYTAARDSTNSRLNLRAARNQESRTARHDIVVKSAENRYDLAAARNVRCIAIAVTFQDVRTRWRVGRNNVSLTVNDGIRATYESAATRWQFLGASRAPADLLLDESEWQSQLMMTTTTTPLRQSATYCTDNRKLTTSFTEGAAAVTRTVTMDTRTIGG